MRPNKREESWRSLIPLNTVSLRTGMIWKRSGTILSTLNWEFPQMNTPSSWLKPHWTPRLTEKRWHKSCSKHSMSPIFTLPSKPCCPSTQLVEPPVLFATQEMVSPTPYPSMKVSPFPTPSQRSNWLEETWQDSWLNSLPKEATTSSVLPNLKSSETSRKRLASLPSTTTKPWRPPKIVHLTKRPTNFQTVKSSPLETLDSDAPNISSSPSKWTARNSPVSKNWPTTLSKSAMLMSEEIFTLTSSSQEEPPCSKALVKDFSRKLNKELPRVSPLRLLPVPTEDSLSGEEVPLWHHSQHLQACGSPRKTMMNTELQLFIENVFEPKCDNNYK